MIAQVTSNRYYQRCFNDLSLLTTSSDISPFSAVFQAEAVTVARKRSCRLYPSLPQTRGYEAAVPEGGAALHLHSRSTDAQVGTFASVEATIHRAPGNERVFGVTGNIRVKKKKKNPKMRKKEVSGFSCVIPIFYSSVLPV